jgi:acyl-CoA reductase-like NAD-dependent aldehyde dehydrogenase
MERVLAYAELAKSEGGQLLHGGGRPAGLKRGYYIDPIVARAADNRARSCQEEVFGPFVSVLTFDGVEDAIRIANESRFGLVAYAWTRDIGRAQALSRGIRAGVVWVNTAMARDLRAGFGGVGESGIGREGGDGSAQLFTHEKAVISRLIGPR